MTKTAQKQVVHRSSESGRFVKESYADKHPKTTERQVIKHTPQPPSKKK